MGMPLFPPLGGTQDVFFPRSSAGDLPTIVAGEGIYLIDDRGRRLLDVCSGPFLASLGQGNVRVLQAMLTQGRQLTYTYSRTTRHAANAELTRRLAVLACPGLDRGATCPIRRSRARPARSAPATAFTWCSTRSSAPSAPATLTAATPDVLAPSASNLRLPARLSHDPLPPSASPWRLAPVRPVSSVHQGSPP